VALVQEIYDTAEGIEMSLFKIFEGLSDGPFHQSRAIFYSQLNPRSRRDMINALATVSMMNEPVKLKELQKLIERAGKATSKRNTIAHGEWRTDNTGTVPKFLRSTISPDMRNETEIDESQLKNMLQFMTEVSTEILRYVLANRGKWVVRRNAWRKLA
jgi:hypothetical protein